MTGKKISCPECGSSKVSIYYKTTGTIFYCQNRNCDSIGKYYFVSYHHSDVRYPEIKRKIEWKY